MASEKPLTVAREEFVEDLVNLINNSGLPFFVVLDILRSTVEEVQDAAKRQYEADKAKYEEDSKIMEEIEND